MVIIKKCSVCGELKGLNEFYSQKKKKINGEEYIYYNPYCKKCTKEKATKWAKDNPERRSYLKSKYDKQSHIQQMKKEWNIKNVKSGGCKRWQQENKDKIKEYNLKRANKNHDITNEEWFKCKEYFNFECAYCGIIESEAKEHQGQYFHKEHVDHDGANDISNCVPSCRVCNSSKHNKRLEDWYEPNCEYTTYSYERLVKILKWVNEDYRVYIENPNIMNILKGG